MTFAIGYQRREEDEVSFPVLVERYRPHLHEVYFPWVDFPSGRASIAQTEGYVDYRAVGELTEDLRAIRAMGLRLDLLLNGNCYGADAMSVAMCQHIESVLTYLSRAGCDVDIITTASPAIATMVRRIAPHIEIRASVNMRVSTVKGMEYLSDLFDSFCICRDVNRDLSQLARLKRWCDANGKGMTLLANSGCMRECSYQTFHDNMVAHNEEILTKKNIRDMLPYGCYAHLRRRENWVSLLQNTWIRPEDVDRYIPYTSTLKLATRMHLNPEMVIRAYARRSFAGNLLDLFEPGLGEAIAPQVIDNTRFPADWFERTTECNKHCEDCDYCRRVLDTVLRQGG